MIAYFLLKYSFIIHPCCSLLLGEKKTGKLWYVDEYVYLHYSLET